MSGTICQVMYISSLALGSVTNMSLEMSTPGINNDNGLAICIMGANYNLSDPATSLTYSTGGHQFDIQSESPLQAVETNVVTFSSLLKQDNTFTSNKQLGTFYTHWGSSSDSASRLPGELFHHNSLATADESCSQTGAGWLACPSQCFNVSGTFLRNTRLHFMATVRNPQANESSSFLLPKLWVTPLKHSYDNGTLHTAIAGPSKTGALCTGPVLHNTYSESQQQLFDACSLASDLGVYVGNQSSVETCLSALQAHAQVLQAVASANATQATVLPLQLQAPPLLSPWPPNSSLALNCSDSTAVSVRTGKHCISCDGGTLASTVDGVPVCECGPASVRLPVGARACSDAVHAGHRSVASLEDLPRELCTFFKQVQQDETTKAMPNKGGGPAASLRGTRNCYWCCKEAAASRGVVLQEYNSMIRGELATEIVAMEYGTAFLQLAWPLLDVSTYLDLHAAYYPDMLLDVRHPDVPTRARGVWNVCSTCNAEGQFIEGRSKKLATTHDWRFQAAHMFRFIGYVLYRVGSECTALYDPRGAGHLAYGPYEPTPCAFMPDASSHLLQV